MAIKQIQKSSTFKPEMIGDLVEVTVYSKVDGSLTNLAATLEGFFTRDGVTYAFFQGIGEPLSVVLAEYTISVTHYEFIFEADDEEDDE